MNKSRDFDLSASIIVGIICFLLGFGMLIFGLYILPHILFGWQYEVPLFVHKLSYWLETHHNLEGFLHLSAILLPFFLAAMCLLVIARILTNVEEEHHKRKDEEQGKTGTIEFSAQGAVSKTPVRKLSKVYLLILIGVAVLILIEFLLFYSIY